LIETYPILLSARSIYTEIVIRIDTGITAWEYHIVHGSSGIFTNNHVFLGSAEQQEIVAGKGIISSHDKCLQKRFWRQNADQPCVLTIGSFEIT